MNKADLIEALTKDMKVTHDRPVSKADVQAFLSSFTAVVSEEMTHSDVVIPGFGKFHVSERAARKGRNPQNGTEIDIPAARVPKFTPGKLLKETVNS
ncbi:HU family DNA-binding protein [Marinobacterium litorale]|uniref:HU family DNA-binding protein n=1 Tax=Marinobacterium litorale TaxID=404770 RepID=UPI00042385E7|nr:HU family DNA-binding protein [Marinobacterium litorale]